MGEKHEKDKAMKNLIDKEDSAKERIDDEHDEKVTFDDILSQLGEFGLEQKLNYFMFSLPYIMSAMQLLGWVFVGAEMPHRCRLPYESENASFEFDRNEATLAKRKLQQDKRKILPSCILKIKYGL